MNVNLRRSMAAVTVVLAAPTLSSCGINFNAQTDQVYNPGVGVNNRTGTVDVLHALIVSGEDGSGTLVAAFVNESDTKQETLTGVSGVGRDKAVTASAGGPITIPADGFYQLADKGEVGITGDQVKPGAFVSLRFTFQEAQSVIMDVPVVANRGEFSDVPLPSSAAPSPTESPSPTPSAKPKKSKGSPTASPSASPS